MVEASAGAQKATDRTRAKFLTVRCQRFASEFCTFVLRELFLWIYYRVLVGCFTGCQVAEQVGNKCREDRQAFKGSALGWRVTHGFFPLQLWILPDKISFQACPTPGTPCCFQSPGRAEDFKFIVEFAGWLLILGVRPGYKYHHCLGSVYW